MNLEDFAYFNKDLFRHIERNNHVQPRESDQHSAVVVASIRYVGSGEDFDPNLFHQYHTGE
jgi:hypothetical protein